jgi:protein SCO1/2
MIPTILERFGVSPRNAVGGGWRSGLPPFPNVRLTTHRKKAVRFYDDLLRGKVVVLSFMYTRCTGTCPPTIMGLRRLQRVLEARAGQDVCLYSVTLDPAYDTADVLDRYATTVEAGPSWQFLTGTVDDIDVLRRRLGFVNPDASLDADKSQHSGLLLFGNEPADRWAACPAPFGTARLVKLLSRIGGVRERA